MSTSTDFATYAREQLTAAGNISLRKMFGDYGVYLKGKFIGLICDDQFFLKETPAGRRILGAQVEEGLPYQGAKTFYFVIEDLEDREFLARLLQASAPEIPWQKIKKNRLATKSL